MIGTILGAFLGRKLKPLTPEEEKMLLDLWEPMLEKKNSFFYHTLRRIRKLKKRDFVDAETFTARDKLCRVSAAECFEKTQKLANNRPHPREKNEFAVHEIDY